MQFIIHKNLGSHKQSPFANIKFHFISFTKLKTRRMENDFPGDLVLVGGGRLRERHGRVNIVQTVCTYVWKLTNETCSTYFQNVWGRG
jgi:hypothetical protein